MTEQASGRVRLGLLAVAGAALAWSIGAIGAGVLLSRGFDPLHLAGARVVLTAIGFAAVALLSPPRRRSGAVPVGPMLGFATSIALVSVMFFLAIARLGVAVGTVLHYLAPLLVVVWGVATTRRRPSNFVLCTSALSVVGVLLVSGVLSRGVGDVDLRGILFGLLSATCFAAYTIFAERMIAAYGPVHALLRGFGLASVAWVLVQAGRGWPADLFAPANLGWVLFVGLVGTWLPFLLYVWGIQRVRAERAAIAATLEPVVSGSVAWIVLGEALTPVQALGGALILVAVMLLQSRGAATAPTPEAAGHRTVSRFQSP